MEEALAAGLPFEFALFDSQLASRPQGRPLLEALRGAVPRGALVEVTPAVLRAVADTDTPQGVLAAVKLPGWTWEDLWRRPDPLVLVIDGLRDPGNLGTLIRSAEAAGAAGVVVSRGTVDPTNPKTLRAAMGASFRLPVLETASGIEAARLLRRRGVRLVATDPRASRPVFAADLTGPVAVAVGGEAAGLGPGLRAAADEVVTIPILGAAESLNAAVAGAIVLYEAVRQRLTARDQRG